LAKKGDNETSAQETFIQLASKRRDAAAKHQQSMLRKKLLTQYHRRLRENTKGNAR